MTTTPVAAAAEAAYTKLLDSVKSVAASHGLQLNGISKRTLTTALEFTSQLTHLVVDDLQQDIFKCTKVHVKVELNGTTQSLLILVPRATAIQWSFFEQYSKPQLLVMGVACVFSAIFVASIGFAVYYHYSN